MTGSLAIYCADVGRVSKNFGWSMLDSEGAVSASGTDIGALAERLAGNLRAGTNVALGFECPLWVPLPIDGAALGRARPGESGPGRRSRPWSFGSGIASLGCGLVQVPWLLRAILPAGGGQATLDWDQFTTGAAGLFIWEAMVTDTAKGTSHEDDARIGALTFHAALPDPRLSDACPASGPVFSLAAAAMLRAGWSGDPLELSRPALVLRATGS